MEKPRQSFGGLWNISFGFLGIQIAFALQNANMSRIFQTLGANVDKLAFLAIAAPASGLLVQPLIGYFSDRTWGRFGRRRPYFLAGALLAGGALFAMPHASILIAAALFLWLLDASLNVSMEPFRAFVGDMVPSSQRASGYAFQTAFIGIGAVIGSLAPFALAHLGVPNQAPPGEIPASVRDAFYIGAVAIVGAVFWTVWSVREYAPEEMAAYHPPMPAQDDMALVAPKRGVIWLLVGVALVVIIYHFDLDLQLYVLGAGLSAFGLAQILNQLRPREGALAHILSDLAQMPAQMRRLAVAQFFTWFALFIMWSYTTPVVTQYVFHSTDPTSIAYNSGADWVGVLFSVYNGVAALAAFLLPILAKRIGHVMTHLFCLAVGAASFASLLAVHESWLLIAPFIGLGVAWASILTMPYVILSVVLPPQKLGIYMGIFNFFIVLPQLVVATTMGAILHTFFPHAPIWTMFVAALVMGIAALAMLRVKENAVES